MCLSSRDSISRLGGLDVCAPLPALGSLGTAAGLPVCLRLLRCRAHPPPCLDLSTLQEYPHLAVTQPQRLPLLPLLCAFSSSILPVWLCTHESEQPFPACLPRTENGHLDDAQCEPGVSPSEPTIARNSSNDLANAFTAAHDKIARHRDLQACCPLRRRMRGSCLELAQETLVSGRPLHPLTPLMWPCVEGRPTPDRCALSSWRPSPDVAIRHSLKWKSGFCRLLAASASPGLGGRQIHVTDSFE